MKAQNGGQQELLPAGERIDEAPQWFVDALANKPQDKTWPMTKRKFIIANGRPDADAPNLVLVHGGGAMRWYDFIAPLLSPYYNAISVDLPGMGDSGWLQTISAKLWPKRSSPWCAMRFTSKPAIIGHSMGGMVSLMTSHLYHGELAALMMCDYYVRPPHAHEEWYMEEDENGVMRRAKHARPAFMKILTRLWRAFACNPNSHAPINLLSISSVNIHCARSKVAGRGNLTPYVSRLPHGRDWPEIYRDLPLPTAAMFGELSHDWENITRNEIIAYMKSLRPNMPHFDLLGARHHVLLTSRWGLPPALNSKCKIGRHKVLLINNFYGGQGGSSPLLQFLRRQSVLP